MILPSKDPTAFSNLIQLGIEYSNTRVNVEGVLSIQITIPVFWETASMSVSHVSPCHQPPTGFPLEHRWLWLSVEGSILAAATRTRQDTAALVKPKNKSVEILLTDGKGKHWVHSELLPGLV